MNLKNLYIISNVYTAYIGTVFRRASCLLFVGTLSSRPWAVRGTWRLSPIRMMQPGPSWLMGTDG